MNICVPPPNSNAEILSPKVTVLGSGAFGRLSGNEDRALINGISALIKDAPESSLILPPGEDTARDEHL